MVKKNVNKKKKINCLTFLKIYILTLLNMDGTSEAHIHTEFQCNK